MRFRTGLVMQITPPRWFWTRERRHTSRDCRTRLTYPGLAVRTIPDAADQGFAISRDLFLTSVANFRVPPYPKHILRTGLVNHAKPVQASLPDRRVCRTGMTRLPDGMPSA